MLQTQSIVQITDNSGGKIGRVFKVIGGSKKRYARIGDIVVLSVLKAEPRKSVKKKDILRAVVVRQKQALRRKTVHTFDLMITLLSLLIKRNKNL